MSSEKKPSPLASPEPWSKVSAGYEKFTRGFLAKYSEHAIELLELEKRHQLLDVACGPGTTSLLAAPQVQSIQAIDFSEAMVEIFRSHIAARSLTNVAVRVGDGQALPFENGTFDRAISMFGLMFFPDRVKGMKELYRCLQTGGRAVISSWAPVDMSPLMQAMFDAGRFANPESPPPKRDLESLENPEVFARELQEAGFSKVRIEERFCCYDFESGAQLWGEMVEGAVPLVMAREGMPKEAWDTFSNKCRGFLQEKIDATKPLGSTAYLAVAER